MFVPKTCKHIPKLASLEAIWSSFTQNGKQLLKVLQILKNAAKVSGKSLFAQLSGNHQKCFQIERKIGLLMLRKLKWLKIYKIEA